MMQCSFRKFILPTYFLRMLLLGTVLLGLLPTKSFADGRIDDLRAMAAERMARLAEVENNEAAISALYPHDPAVLEPFGVQLVTQKYGPVIVKEGQTFFKSFFKPWMGWWYPAGETTLFADPVYSTLGKLELWQADQGLIQNSTARRTAWEMYESFGKDTVSWEGLCYPLAYASILEPEPVGARLVGDQCFSPADIKALMALRYETNVRPNEEPWNGLYGQRNDDRGLLAPLSIYTDLYPAEIIRAMQVNLDQRGVPMIIDDDAGAPVWARPIFKGDIFVERDEEYPETRVKVQVRLATVALRLTEEQRAEDALEGVRPRVTNLTYRGIMNGVWQDGNFVVSDSRWIGEFHGNHPDYLIELPIESQSLIRIFTGAKASEQQAQADLSFAREYIRSRSYSYNGGVINENVDALLRAYFNSATPCTPTLP